MESVSYTHLASAVLVLAIGSAIIGLIIFVPKILNRLNLA